jgi:hypothetical protein
MPAPPDFLSRPLAMKYIDASRLLRIFRLPAGAHMSPLYYGTAGKNRFDCPTSAVPTFGVAYAAFDLPTCFAETVVRDRNRKPLVRAGIAVDEKIEVQTRHVATLTASTRLHLADMTDVALFSVGAEAGEFNSEDYANTTQLWARQLHDRPEEVDGLLYRSRFLNGRQAVAIFERGGARVGLGAGLTTRLDSHVDYAATLSELRVTLI